MVNARYRRAVYAAVLLVLTQAGSAQSPQPVPPVVISQIYGGGGGSGALFPDFIELYNRSSQPVSLAGWSLQYASATGTGNLGAANQITVLPDVLIPPGTYYLVRESGAGNFPTPFYQAGVPIAMAATAGKVALARIPTSLGCNGSSTPCSPDQLANVVDLVGYGNANFFEGSGAAPTLNSQLAALRRDGGATDTNDNAADFVADTPNPRNSGNVIGLSINDVALAEGDGTNPVAAFTVGLNAAALAAVTFTIATEDITATAGFDYVASPPTVLTIPVGQRAVTFNVTILGDLAVEPDETFAVVLTNVQGAVVADDRGVGTIQNDDVAEYAIHHIQGDGNASPHAGERLATTGIVTSLKSNGYFMQTPDAEGDGLATTSEGLFVFTGTVPAFAVGDAVRATGTIVEFRRTTDALPGTLTEMGGSPRTVVLSAGNVLPAAIDAATFDVNAPNRATQLERYESMRVRAASLNVVQPTNRFGEFYGVLAGTARPFREPGVDVNDVLPPSTPPALPFFDGNHERIMVDSDEALIAGARRAAVVVATGASVSPVEGPLDYAFDTYRISLDGNPTVTAGMSVAPVPTPAASEFTVAALNLLNFNPPNPGNPAQVAAFADRLTKASLVIRTVLHTPDVLGLIEVGDLDVLTQLAARVNADAGTSYHAYLLEGVDNGTVNDQDVGYLVNTSRVTVAAEPTQFGKGETFQFCGDDDVLFDRPPFVLRATATGMPVTVILNHLKSLIEVNSNEIYRPQSGGPCTGTVGERNRLKRRLGAERLADLIEDLRNESLVVLGDMNAFQFNDGYVDVMGTVAGSPAPAAQVIEPSADRWSHTLVDLITALAPGQQYSYVFDGNAQVLDHVLVNAPMLARLTRFAYARVNADFPEALSADPTIPDRFSDHDGPVAYFSVAADLTTTTDLPPVITSGSAFTYNTAVLNGGPDAASTVTVTNQLPANASFNSVLAPAGWSCSSASGTLTCQAAALPASSAATFLVAMTAACAVENGTTIASSTNAASPTERAASTGNNASGDTASISNPAPVIGDIVVQKPKLWPPDFDFQLFVVDYDVTDNCGKVKTRLSARATDNSRGSDTVVVNEHLVLLKAPDRRERKRTYALTVTATDSAGNISTRDTAVVVR